MPRRDGQPNPSIHLIRASREHRLSQAARRQLIRVSQNFFIPRNVLEDCDSLWQQRHCIDMARTLTIRKTHPEWIPVGRSAALLNCLGGFGQMQDLQFVSPEVRRTKAVMLPGIALGNGTFIEPVRVAVHHAPTIQLPDDVIQGDGVPNLIGTAMSAALLHPGREGFVIGSQALAGVCRYDKWSDAFARPRAEELRGWMLDWLGDRPSGTRNIREATWTIENIDPGCESVGEAALLWALKAAGVENLSTQVRVEYFGNTYFIDIVIGDLRIAIEFDGRVKYGATADDVIAADEAQLRRERELRAMGYVIVRFRWADLFDPNLIFQEVRGVARRAGRELALSAHPRLKIA